MVSKKQAQIAIIGGGIAGLTAADYLINHFGFKNVTVYEAHDRIGGRIWTSEFEGGNVEMGAQFMHAKNTPVYKIARQHDLLNEVESKKWFEYPESCLLPGGKSVPRELVEDLFEEFYYGTEDKVEQIAKKVSSEPIKSLGELYRFEFENWKTKKMQKYPEVDFDALLIVVQRVLELDHGCMDLNKLSLSVIDEWKDYPEEEFVPVDAKNGGYSKLVQVIADRLPEGTVKLSQPVKNIKHSADQADLLFGDGHFTTVDHVIVTCSLGHLKANQSSLFTPNLPQPKKDAISNMGSVDSICRGGYSANVLVNCPWSVLEWGTGG